MTCCLPTFGILPNLNLYVKKSVYELSTKRRNNQITKDIYFLMSKQSTSTTWFSFCEGVIAESIVHEVLPKLNSKALLHKIKASISLCAKIWGQKRVKTSQKRVNPKCVVHPKKEFHEKDMLVKINGHI